MAVSAWQALSARRQSRSASDSAEAAERAAAAAERQALLAERQALATEKQTALVEEQLQLDESRLAAEKLKQDNEAVRAVLPAIRDVLLQTPDVIYADTASPPDLFDLLRRVVEAAGEALSLAHDPILIERLEILRRDAKAAQIEFIPAWLKGLRVEPPLVSRAQLRAESEKRRDRKISSLLNFKRNARSFYAEYG